MKTLLILLVIQNIYILIIKKKVLKKTDILKSKESLYVSYFCKNDICTQVNTDFLKKFVEIPDEKGNIKRYISESYSYNE